MELQNTSNMALPVINQAMSEGGKIISTLLANRANRKLAEYSFNKNLEQWNRQNEYNSPVNQMKRLAEANLNPNLVYGNSGVTGNSSSEAAKYVAPHIEAPQINLNPLGVIGEYTSIKAQQQQINTAKANEDYIRSQIILNGLRAADQAARNNMNIGDGGVYGYQRAIAANRAKGGQLQNMFTDMRMNNLMYQNSILKATVDDQIKAISLKNQLYESSIKRNLQVTENLKLDAPIKQQLLKNLQQKYGLGRMTAGLLMQDLARGKFTNEIEEVKRNLARKGEKWFPVNKSIDLLDQITGMWGRHKSNQTGAIRSLNPF